MSTACRCIHEWWLQNSICQVNFLWRKVQWIYSIYVSSTLRAKHLPDAADSQDIFNLSRLNYCLVSYPGFFNKVYHWDRLTFFYYCLKTKLVRLLTRHCISATQEKKLKASISLFCQKFVGHGVRTCNQRTDMMARKSHLESRTPCSRVRAKRTTCTWRGAGDGALALPEVFGSGGRERLCHVDGAELQHSGDVEHTAPLLAGRPATC